MYISDDDVGLSGAQIGGIVGGVLFLIVAIALAVVGIMCNHRRDGQKQQNDKYGMYWKCICPSVLYILCGFQTITTYMK